MHIPHFNRLLLQIVGKAFRHFLRERSYKHSSLFGNHSVYLALQIVDLPFRRADFNDRVQKPRRADNLFGIVVGYRKLVIRGGCGNENNLPYPLVEFFKRKRTVIVSRFQPETEIDEILFSRPVAVIHRPYLRHGHMAFVDKRYKIFGEII